MWPAYWPMDKTSGLDVVSMGLMCGIHVGPMDTMSRPDVVSMGAMCRPHISPMKFVKKRFSSSVVIAKMRENIN